jgi:RHS repeat-associated protein
MTTAATCETRKVSWWPSYYRGEQYDSDLGLYYLRARYYNPATGRFLSRDPEDGHRWDPKTLHKYLYANGDPVSLNDPTGRAAFIETIFTTTEITTPAEALFDTGVAIVKVFCRAITALNLAWYAATNGQQYGPGWMPLPIKAGCGLASFF